MSNQSKKKGREVRVHTCDLCDYESVVKSNVMRHRRQVHEHQQPYKCDMCSSAFGYKWVLVGHKKDMHGVGEMVKCPKCGKKFSRNGNMHEHMRTCGKEKPRCAVCLKPFACRRNLNRHTKSVHQTDSVCVCHQCGKTFSRPFCLKRHVLRMHTGSV